MMKSTRAIFNTCFRKPGFASQRALQRLALYQAKSRAFGLPTFLKNIRTALGCGEIEARTVPGHLVRDIGLPPFSHTKTR